MAFGFYGCGRILIGIGVNTKSLAKPEYINLYDDFDFWTVENELKFNDLRDGYGKADLIINGTDKPVRGHLMVSHVTVPETTPRQEVREYIIETIKRYPKITDWDLFGEALADVGKLRGYWSRVEFTLIDLLDWAKEANRDNNYYYSDFNLKAKYKWEMAVKLVNELDINLSTQFHHHDYGRVWFMGDWLSPIISKVNNKCLLSEVSIQSNNDIIQATCYKRLLDLAYNKIDICIWNLTDANKRAYLIDNEGNFKPSYWEVERYLEKSLK